MAKLLVVDDEPSICWGLAELGKRLRHTVLTASLAEEGLALAGRERPDAILLDVRLPGMDGLSALPMLKEVVPESPIIIMTAHGDLGTAVEAVRKGAFDYVAKPFDLAQIERVIERALARPAPAAEAANIDVHADGFVGRTPIMQEVFKRIALVAPSDACVMLGGESGTGKELVARAIHRYSRRSSGPFVAVNVAALSSTLAESELFGHVRGSFTGADQPRAGLLVEADGGTLFLDEVADIPLAVQVKLLRALEHGEVMPVGSGRTVRTNFRLISATHRDLPARVRAGEFRHDLYYRLSTFHVELPPLRARRDDISLLAEHFAQRLSAGSVPQRISQQAIDELKRRDWHGNVRELRNAIEHALILAQGGTLLPEHLPAPLPPLHDGLLPPSPAEAALPSDELRGLIQDWAQARLRAGESTGALYDQFLALVEPPFLEAAIKRHHGQCAAAARALGIHRTTLRKKLDQYGIAGLDEE
jgi:two-component system nitrogen regulation response regulator GlnG